MAGKRRVARAGTAFLLCLAVTQAGCALLVPPAWRPRAPVPLHGEIPAADEPSEELAHLSDADLEARIQQDRERLLALTVQAEGPMATPETEREIRDLAQRLPQLQRESRARGSAPGARIRHPVIQ